MEVVNSVLELIGNTPILKLSKFDTGPCELYIKMESENPGGSIKDRIAVCMIEAAEKEGKIKPGGTIIEATAGNTGLGLGLVVLAVGLVIAHPTMFQFLVTHGLVLMMAAFAFTLLLTRDTAWTRRRWLLLAALAVTLWPLSLLRQEGQVGALSPELAARWAPTAEDLFLESRPASTESGAAAEVAEAAAEVARADWPGFRGARVDVVAADEGRPAVEDHRLGVEARAGLARQDGPLAFDAGVGAQLEQLDAAVEQRAAAVRVA